MIPPEKSDAITLALREAFGVTQFDDIRDLTERPGSNRAFRIVIRGTAYLLRINTRRGDMARQITCMRAAADAGLAPRVWYASAADRVTITDFVNTVPFSAADALTRIPATLRTLHALPPFPTAPFNTTCTFLLHQGPMLDGLLQKVRTSSTLSANETRELLACYEQVAEVYSHLEPDTAPSHNDLFKPDNMLFDGDRLWLVDWEAAFQNDRYADIAVVANMLVTNESEEAIYLEQYLGEPPNEYQRARFYLMRQLAHMFYAMAFLTIESPNTSTPPYNEYQQRFWTHEVSLSDDHARALYARVHWQQLKANMRQPRFADALKLIS